MGGRNGSPWIENNDLILLLDGLDEVISERRRVCADAINKFCFEYGLTGIVVCSRTREYEELATRLNVNSAVLIQPLTREQIYHYIDAGGIQLVALGNAMRTDQVLEELAQAPLMLSVMSLAYSGQSVDNIISVPDDPVQRRQHLFDAYVYKMFARTARTAYEPFSKDDTIHWLTWLAARMLEDGQTEFLIERMQSSWLQSYDQRRMYSMGYEGISGLLLGLVGLVSGLHFGLLPGLFGLVGGLHPGLAGS